jgi:hypothetical protein
MATEDAINQAAVAKRRSDELIARIHNVGGDAASIQNAGPLRQYEVRQRASIKLYAYIICINIKLWMFIHYVVLIVSRC